MQHLDFDVVVVGSGCAGLTAAIVAAHSGLRVVVVEKATHFGGTSAWSGGGCWIPANPMMAQLGIADSRAAAERYITGIVGNALRTDLLDAYLDNSNAMLGFMLQHTKVTFFARTPAPDWRQDVDGAMIGGRALASPLYDGRLLGRAMLRKLSRPLHSFNAPLGMMMSPLDLDHAMKMFRSWASFRHIAGIVARYGIDLVRFGRGSRLAMGNALMGRLLRSAMDAGVALWTETGAERLVVDHGKVTGVIVRQRGQDIHIGAARGVVLASGGFAANKNLRARFFSSGADQASLVSPANVGDGLIMAERVAAAVETRNLQPAQWDLVSNMPGRSDPGARCLHALRDLPKPGIIVVGPDGRRFGNEGIHQLGNAMVERRFAHAWIICDHRAMIKYGVGLVWPFGINLGLLTRRKYVVTSPTIRALAEKIALDPATLEATVARFNNFAVAGVDPDFGRGETILDRTNGDPAHKPNPSLGPLNDAPFYAVRASLSDVGSVVGLRVDASARVCQADERPIPGLYACGMDMNALWAGGAIGLGMNHGHNMTFAYIAAQHMAANAG